MEKGFLMQLQLKSFHPITKVCAYFGAGLCLLFGIAQTVSALFVLPDVLGSGLELGKGVLILYLGWSFWFAAKYSANPFTELPFSMRHQSNKM